MEPQIWHFSQWGVAFRLNNIQFSHLSENAYICKFSFSTGRTSELNDCTYVALPRMPMARVTEQNRANHETGHQVAIIFSKNLALCQIMPYLKYCYTASKYVISIIFICWRLCASSILSSSFWCHVTMRPRSLFVIIFRRAHSIDYKYEYTGQLLQTFVDVYVPHC